MTALKEIHNNINNGKKYGEIEKNVKHPFFWTVLIADEKYIYWQNFSVICSRTNFNWLCYIKRRT